MLSGLLLVALAAAPPPQALAGAQWALEIPRLSASAPLLGFFERAGKRSALLRPRTWLPELHPIFVLDPRDPDTLAAAGVDPGGPLVVSGKGKARMACVRLDDVERFEKEARVRLEGAGDLRPARQGAARGFSAERGGRPLAGYLRKGPVACAFSFSGEKAWMLSQGARAVERGATPRSAAAVVWTPRYTAELIATATELYVDGTAAEGEMLLPQDRAASRIPSRVPSGLLFTQGVFDARALAERSEPSLLALCGACSRQALHAVVAFLSTELTGELVWRVDRLRPRAELGTRTGQLRALIHAGGVVLAHPARVKQRLPGLLTALGAEPRGDGWALPFEGAPVTLSLADDVLWFGTDEEALARVRDAPRATTAPPRGAFVRLDGPAAARALSRLSILDLLRSPELGPLVAASAELGPLLEESPDIEMTLRPAGAGQGRFTLRWRLEGG